MGFLEDLKNGDIKSIILVIFGILFFHQYWYISNVDRSIRKNQCKEPMADVSIDIKEAVKQVYLDDVEAIRNLSEVATKLQKDGLTIPGNLTVTGKITTKGEITAQGEISNEKYSLSGLDKKIDSDIESLTKSIDTSIEKINTNMDKELKKKIDKNSIISLEDNSNPGYKLATSNLDITKVNSINVDSLNFGLITAIYNRKWKINNV